jgi:hypothetical protein
VVERRARPRGGGPCCGYAGRTLVAVVEEDREVGAVVPGDVELGEVGVEPLDGAFVSFGEVGVRVGGVDERDAVAL